MGIGILKITFCRWYDWYLSGAVRRCSIAVPGRNVSGTASISRCARRSATWPCTEVICRHANLPRSSPPRKKHFSVRGFDLSTPQVLRLGHQHGLCGSIGGRPTPGQARTAKPTVANAAWQLRVPAGHRPQPTSQSPRVDQSALAQRVHESP